MLIGEMTAGTPAEPAVSPYFRLRMNGSTCCYTRPGVEAGQEEAHAIFSTLQGTQNPHTNQTLQRTKNANTQPTHPS